MTSRCANDCGGYAGHGHSLCQACRVERNNDFRTAREERTDGDEKPVECTNCGERYETDGSDPCPECGARRRRFIGPLEVATDDGGRPDGSRSSSELRSDGGDVEYVPARIDYDELIGLDCPVCEEEITPGALRFNGQAWAHKSSEAHPQAGHHRISETIDEAGLVTDGGRDTSTGAIVQEGTDEKPQWGKGGFPSRMSLLGALGFGGLGVATDSRDMCWNVNHKYDFSACEYRPDLQTAIRRGDRAADRDLRADGGRDRLTYLTNGQLREEISYAVGGDPTRYGRDASGRGLTKDEVYRAAVQLQPEDDDHDLRKMTLENLYRVVCRWAGGEYSANSGNAWGINRANLKLIHDALGGRPPQEIVTDGGLEEVFRRETIQRCECGAAAIGDCDCPENDDLRADGGREQSDGDTDRPDPEDDPFACNGCGCYIGESKRIRGEGFCDACLADMGFAVEGYR